MDKFCKLFETEKGQILVKIDRNSDGNPEVRIYAQPPEFGVCSVASSYKDDDEGWDRAEKWFNEITQTKATSSAETLFKVLVEE